MAYHHIDRPSEDIIRDLRDLTHVDSPQICLSHILELAKADPKQMRVLHHDKSTNTTVLKVQQPIIPPGTTMSVTVVCKIVYGPGALTRLRKEYDVYDRLKSLQGQGIPHCYGLFHCPAAVNQACLLLEYGGETLPNDASQLEAELPAVMTKSLSFRSVLYICS